MKRFAGFLTVIVFSLVGLETFSFSELDKKEFFGRRVYDMEDDSMKVQKLDAEIYGIYFSAHWCPPCRKFSPVLVDAYNQMKQNGCKFEVIFVSWDQTESDMYTYMQELKMPWLAVEFKSDEAEDLKEKYEVNSIPRLIIIDSSGNLITGDGRQDVQSLGAEAYKKWIKSSGE